MYKFRHNKFDYQKQQDYSKPTQNVPLLTLLGSDFINK